MSHGGGSQYRIMLRAVRSHSPAAQTGSFGPDFRGDKPVLRYNTISEERGER